jgi:SET domain-containing protein
MIEKTIDNLKNTYCRIGKSKIDGVGVIAIRNIPKNTNPFYGVKEKKWIELKVQELKKVDKEVLKMIDSFFVIEKDKTVYVPEDGLNGMDISFFLNNSKKPNVKVVGDGKESALNFVTIRKIIKGEELLVSYADYDEKYQ